MKFFLKIITWKHVIRNVGTEPQSVIRPISSRFGAGLSANWRNSWPFPTEDDAQKQESFGWLQLRFRLTLSDYERIIIDDSEKKSKRSRRRKLLWDFFSPKRDSYLLLLPRLFVKYLVANFSHQIRRLFMHIKMLVAE